MSNRCAAPAALAALLAAAACSGGDRQTQQASDAPATGPADARVATPHAGGPGEWAMPAADYANSRYSELREITPANVRTLRAAWTFSTGVPRGHEGAPLVVGNTMYLVTPYPNVAYALDLTTPGYPLRWKFRPENAQIATGIACCDVVNRGAAFADGKIVYNLLDGHTVAVDAGTGEELWRVAMGDL